MNRQDWEFEYSVANILKASEQRATFHRARVEFWKERFNEVKASLPETITIEDAEAFFGATAASNSSYNAPRLRLDPDIERRFNDATRKVIEHRKNAEIYERWVAVLLGEDSERALQLKMADVEFFSLQDGELTRLTEQDEKE